MPSRPHSLPLIVTLVLLALLLLTVPTTAQDGGSTTLLSVASDGTLGNGASGQPALSADGRFVAFVSAATNLVPSSGTDEGDPGIYLHQRAIAQTTKVSLGLAGQEPDGASAGPTISGEGRFVAFESTATNLVANDTNGFTDIFLYDRLRFGLSRLSFPTFPATSRDEADNHSGQAAISEDGLHVAFTSLASNLVQGDTNEQADVFVYDRTTDQVTRLSLSSAGTQGNGASQNPAISADGRWVAFQSVASNLVAGDTNATVDIFLHDRLTKQTTRVSVAPNGAQANNGSLNPSLSGDGRLIAFESAASNLVPGDFNGTVDIFVYDRGVQQTTRVSVSSGGLEGNITSYAPAISPDGSAVAFGSFAANLVPTDTNTVGDVFVHVRARRQTTRLSVSTEGTQGNALSTNPAIARGGAYVVFESLASSLVRTDSNGFGDVFGHSRPVALFLPLTAMQQAPVNPCLSAEVEPNQTPAQANAQSPLCRGTTITGRLPTGDSDDYYRVEVGAGGAQVSISLTNLPAGTDYDLYAYDTASNEVGSSAQPGTTPESLTLTLPAGRYYIRVYPRTGRSDALYTLRYAP